MACFSRTFWTCQAYLTAITTLVAGMPYFVCACSPELDQAATPPQTVQSAECHCCGSCASMPGSDSSAANRNRSCCSSGIYSQNTQPTSSSPQARGKGCTKVAAVSKTPGILSTKTSKQVKALSGNWAFSQVVLVPSSQVNPQGSAFRWTGHSPAPPNDLVTSLQRLLI